MPGDHPCQFVTSGQREETFALQRVERHVDPVQSGVGEIVRNFGKFDAVGGERKVDAERCEHFDEADNCARTSGSPPVKRIASNP